VHAQREFADYLKCGRLELGFLRVLCTDCHAGRFVAFSCKQCGFYSGHPALLPVGQPAAVQNSSRRFCARAAVRRRMAEGAPLLVDVLLREPMRQSVLSVRIAFFIRH
jgi:hypothetical protein